MAINDGDAGAGQNGQKGWGGLGAHSIVFGKTPQETALITLGNASSGGALFFLSAVNPGINTFSFRASDLASSVVNPASATLKIDGQSVPLVAGAKNLDATDFTFTKSSPFAAGTHTYSIEVRDTNNQLVTDSGTFIAAATPTLTAAMKATGVDQTKRGFVWSVFQNEAAHPFPLTPHEYLDDAELALNGEATDGSTVLPNLADLNAQGIALAIGVEAGPVVKFDIDTVINLNQFADGTVGSATFSPDDQMPGVPGINGFSDGIDAEIRTFVELPAGVVTLGVTCDDLFRAMTGNINDPATAVILGEDLGLQNRTTLMQLFVVEAGIYPLRIVYQERTGGAYVEVFSVKADGEKALLNDTANGGLRTFRVGAPAGVKLSAVTITRSGASFQISWSEPGAVLQESTDLVTWTPLPAATSPYTPTIGANKTLFYQLKK